MRDETVMPIILVDQDGPLAMFEEKFEQIWRARHPQHPFVESSQRTSFNIEADYEDIYHNDIYAIMDEPGFFRELDPVPGAIEGMKLLNELFPGHVYICTKPAKDNPTCASDKMWWVEHHLGREWLKKMIITPDKKIVRGDYLIDDRYDIDGLVEPTWEHLLYTTPVNLHHTDVRRMNNWSEIVTFFAGKRTRYDLANILGVPLV